MAKKRKLNSRNPKYHTMSADNSAGVCSSAFLIVSISEEIPFSPLSSNFLLDDSKLRKVFPRFMGVDPCFAGGIFANLFAL